MSDKIKSIIESFKSNDDIMMHVKRATFAYYFQHFREHPKAHNFKGPWRDCRCEW